MFEIGTMTGAFFSTWLAGMLLDVTGSDLSIWLFNLVLCALAAFVSYRIKIADYGISAVHNKFNTCCKLTELPNNQLIFPC